MAKVLVVDDQEHDLRWMTFALQEGGHCVTCASSFEAAVSAAMADPPDLLLTDWRLGPGRDGVDVALELLPLMPGLPVIMITGLAPQHLSLHTEFRGLRADAMLEKPVTMEFLVRTVNAAIESRASRAPAEPLQARSATPAPG